MMRLSANLGLLFRDMALPDRIRAAKVAGFDAVEFHDDAQTCEERALRAALTETGLPVCGLNVAMRDTAGCAAISGEAERARADIRDAIRAAEMTGAKAIHVLSGRTGANGDRGQFLDLLCFALERTDRMILIEPICRAAMPDYFLHDLGQAMQIAAEIGHPRLRILFDVFHIEMQHGDCAERLAASASHVGHIQIASVPDRAEPDTGTLDVASVLSAGFAAGYEGAVGGEYLPARPESFAWIAALRQRVGTPPPAKGT